MWKVAALKLSKTSSEGFRSGVCHSEPWEKNQRWYYFSDLQFATPPMIEIFQKLFYNRILFVSSYDQKEPKEMFCKKRCS